MAGQQFVKLRESDVFLPSTMDATINEFAPAEDAFFLTDMFLPFKLVDKEIIIDLINHGAFGRTSPVTLGAEHSRIDINGADYVKTTPGYWREAVKYAEDVLQNAVNPAMPTERWGQGLQISALNLLDIRLNTLIEYVTSKILIDGQYSEARNGVNYTYNPEIPSKLRLNVVSDTPWTSGNAWTDKANSTPTIDIIEAKYYFSRYGHIAEGIVMNSKTALDFLNSAETQAKIKSSFQLVANNADVAVVLEALTRMKLILDDRLYAEETTLTADSPIGDTVINVANATEFTNGDTVTMRNSLRQEEEVVVLSQSGNAITLSAGTNKDYKVGDRFTVYKQYMPDDHFIMKGRIDPRVAANNWLSTPSLVNGRSWSDPLPGKYTWTKFNDDVPYSLEVGAGINGGPKVSRANWMTVKTVA